MIMGYNPCYCWDLKDGCVTIGIWSLLWSIMHLGVFGWQTWVIRRKLDLESNRQGRLSSPYNSYYNSYPDWTQYYVPPSETKFTGIFIIQIINLIAAFFLIFASLSLIYGVYTNSKHLIWPWFPCIAVSTIGSIIYCFLWWAGNVESYWLILTIVEFASVIVNFYCIVCVTVQYRNVLKGYVRQDSDQAKPKKIVYEYMASRERLNGSDSDEYKKKNDLGMKNNRSGRAAADAQLMPALGELQRLYSVRHSQRHKINPPLEQQAKRSVGPSEFKAKFTEAWINEVNSEERLAHSPDRTELHDRGEMPGKDVEPKRLYSRRAKSADAVQQINDNVDLRSCKSKDSVASTRSHRHNYHCHRHRSHRCRRPSGRRRRDPDDGDDISASSDDVSDSRCSRRMHHTRSCSSYRSLRSNRGGAGSDSDTGYSASSFFVSETEADTSDEKRKRTRKSKHHSCKNAVALAVATGEGGRTQGHRPRAVKRYDKCRQSDVRDAERPVVSKIGAVAPDLENVQIPVLEGTSVRIPVLEGTKVRIPVLEGTPGRRQKPPIGGVAVLPQPGTITVPQSIFIPKSDSDSAPGQTYRINSEIVINCDGSADALTSSQSKSSTEPPLDGRGHGIHYLTNDGSRRSPGQCEPSGGQPGSKNAQPMRSSRSGAGPVFGSKRYTSTAV